MTTQGPGPIAVAKTMEGLTAPRGAAGRRRRGALVWWLVFLAGVLYFFVPLYATLLFSLRAQPAFAAYSNVLNDAQFAGSLLYSAIIAVLTIITSIAIIARPRTGSACACRACVRSWSS